MKDLPTEGMKSVACELTALKSANGRDRERTDRRDQNLGSRICLASRVCQQTRSRLCRPTDVVKTSNRGMKNLLTTDYWNKSILTDGFKNCSTDGFKSLATYGIKRQQPKYEFQTSIESEAYDEDRPIR
ncbi:hypothetical protein WA026_022405 [Henosepilachna vigintioctopunctata]|uniref:Uncharacterized protein n=1 Tax=Henosepilachna vigintioctopunctata TaxID=420089 RepID=A0AAW1U684_9CUCU